MQSVEVAELRRRLHLRRDVTGLQPVDLVDDDHDRHPEREDGPSHEAVAGADPLAGAHHEHHHVEIVRHRRLDTLLHTLGQRVDRLLPAG